MNFSEWYSLVYRDWVHPLREPPSKHQAKIIEILDAIEEAEAAGDMVSLFEIEYIDCSGI